MAILQLSGSLQVDLCSSSIPIRTFSSGEVRNPLLHYNEGDSSTYPLPSQQAYYQYDNIIRIHSECLLSEEGRV